MNEKPTPQAAPIWRPASPWERGAVHRRAVLIWGVLGALAGAGLARKVSAQQATPLAAAGETLPPLPDEERRALDAIVARLIEVQNVPGALVGVWIGGRGAWTNATGLGDLQTAAPIALSDHVRIASVSKTFVATAVLQLVDAGKLNLDDTLESFVPGIANGSEITIRQLLGMTAGIFNFVKDPAFDEAYTRDPLADFTPEQEIAIVRQHPADFPPGQKVQYSDSNYVLLGVIIEQVTGESVGDVLTRQILEPLGLRNTSYPETPAIPAPYAHGYAAVPGSSELRDVTRSNPAVANAAGAMISTLDDLRVWGKALAEGTLLSPQTQQERLQVRPLTSGRGGSAGYGLGIIELNGFYGHNGAIFGYSTWLLHSPELDATIVVLANRGETQTEFAGPIAFDIARHLFPEQFPQQANTPAAATPQG